MRSTHYTLPMGYQRAANVAANADFDIQVILPRDVRNGIMAEIEAQVKAHLDAQVTTCRPGDPGFEERAAEATKNLTLHRLRPATTR